MNDHVTALFGLPGFRVLSAENVDGEWHLAVETPDLDGCGECGAVAGVKDRRVVTIRDLPVAGVPVQLRWRKRIFHCRYALCPNKTWTERHDAIAPRAVLTDRTVSAVADHLGVAISSPSSPPNPAHPNTTHPGSS